MGIIGLGGVFDYHSRILSALNWYLCTYVLMYIGLGWELYCFLEYCVGVGFRYNAGYA